MRVAVVGAGAAGLAAGRRLRQRRPALELVIFEAGDAPGGRLATGRRGGFTFDHGAQVIRGASDAVRRLLADELPADELLPVAAPVWVFDAGGRVAEGDPTLNAEPSWCYRGGNSQLGVLLADGLDVRYGLRVASLRQRADGLGRWGLADADGRGLGDFDALLLTPPAPQLAELLAASELDGALRDALAAELAQVRYRPCLSLALAYARPIERPYYALVNVDRQHALAWVALEHQKPGRCPPGQALVVAQLGPAASQQHWATPPGELAELVAAQVAALLGDDPGPPLWADRCAWRAALPDGAADPARLNGSGLLFAGDSTTGLGRVHLAIESGWRAADALGG